VKKLNDRPFEIPLKGIIRIMKTTDLYIEASVDCGANLSKEGDNRLAYPSGSWFKIDKIGDGEMFVVKGPILDMRVDDINKLQKKD
jgi:hypothetical protein